MTDTRAKLEARLFKVCPGDRARSVFLARDDEGLLRAVVKLEATDTEIRKHGHVHATGVELHRV